MSGHTKGPITFDETTGGFMLHAASVGKAHLGNIGAATQRDPHPRHGGGISWETAKANASLWAAAPDLLEALRDMLDAEPYADLGASCECGEYEDFVPAEDGSDDARGAHCRHTRARAAIAKAEGR